MQSGFYIWLFIVVLISIVIVVYTVRNLDNPRAIGAISLKSAVSVVVFFSVISLGGRYLSGETVTVSLVLTNLFRYSVALAVLFALHRFIKWIMRR